MVSMMIEAAQIMESVKEIKEYFKDEGIKLFELDVDCCL